MQKHDYITLRCSFFSHSLEGKGSHLLAGVSHFSVGGLEWLIEWITAVNSYHFLSFSVFLALYVFLLHLLSASRFLSLISWPFSFFSCSCFPSFAQIMFHQLITKMLIGQCLVDYISDIKIFSSLSRLLERYTLSSMLLNIHVSRFCQCRPNVSLSVSFCMCPCELIGLTSNLPGLMIKLLLFTLHETSNRHACNDPLYTPMSQGWKEQRQRKLERLRCGSDREYAINYKPNRYSLGL